MKTKALFLALLATSAFQFGCDEKTAEEVLPSITVITSELLGSFESSCHTGNPIGVTGGASYDESMTITSTSNMNWNRFYYSGANCTGLLLHHTMVGGFSIEGTNTVKFVVTSMRLKPYGSSSVTWADSASGCQPAPAFANMTDNIVSGLTCGFGYQQANGEFFWNKATVTSSSISFSGFPVGGPGYISETAIPSGFSVTLDKQ